MSYRYMRTLLFFDLPSITLKEKKHYRDFVKYLKALGFYRLQESVFCKMDIDKQAMDSSIKRIESKLPPEGSVIALSVTEKTVFNNENITWRYRN